MSEYNQADEWEEQGEEIEIEAIGIDVSSQPIELYKVFKIANLVSGGGEAKHIISEGYVAVNGELETRKRRKMYDGDFFEFNQEYYVVVCDAPVSEPSTEEKFKPEKAVKSDAKTKKPSKKPKEKKAAKTSKPEKKSQAEKPAKQSKSNNKTEELDKKPKQKNENGRGSIEFF